MRNLLLIIITGLLFTSCQKELSFEDPFNPPGTPTTPTTPTTPGTPGSGNGTCLTCDYLPICDNSKWEYIDTLMGTPTNVTTVLNILGDTSMNGMTWKKIKDAATGQRMYSNCNNSVAKLFTLSATSAGGNTVTNITQTPVKGNEPVGATWMDALLNQLGQQVEYRYTMVAKNTTRQVYDSTYSNVVYVRDTTVLKVTGLPEIASIVRHSYYAKGIGMIEQRTEDIGSGMIMMVRKLKKYRL